MKRWPFIFVALLVALTLGGSGALTTAGPTNASFGLWWSGIPDAFSRVNVETNNAIGFLAYGSVNGQATLSASLDSQPIQILDVGTNAMQWRTFIELSQGTHQLQVNALHPSGFYTASATNTFTNSVPNRVAHDTYDASGNITSRVWVNAAGTVTNRTQSLSYDAKNRLRQVIELNTNNYGFMWSAVYDGLNRRIATVTTLVSNGVPSAIPPQTVNSYFDPQVEFLELGVTLSSAPDTEFLEAGTSPSMQTTWKLYGPDLNGQYGGLNGQGGLEGVSPYLNTFNPVISDARGNVLAEITNGVASWTLARPAAYGAVPGHRPVAFGNGVDEAQSSVWHGCAVDVTGYHHLGYRDYDPVSCQWLQSDPRWNEGDPNGQSFCRGDPNNYTDPNGLMGAPIGPSVGDQLAAQWQDELVSQMGGLPGADWSPENEGQTFSSMVDMIPIIGGIKMWYELDTGFDTVTGQHINSSDWTQVAMIGLNILPLALEAAPEEALIEEEPVNIPFGFNQAAPLVGAEGTADAFQYAQLKAQYAALESATAPANIQLEFSFVDGLTAPSSAQNAFAYYKQQALTLDVSTAPNTAVFYSGKGTRQAAEAFAAQNNMVTLEGTTGGLWLDQQGLFGQGSPLTHSEALEVWATLSQRYAQGASGITFGIINNPKPTSIFNSVEFPTLLQNGNVVNVITGGK